jgi:hypothetical protein
MVGLHLALATLFWYFCERPFLSVKSVPASTLTLDGGAARTA